MSIRVAVPVEAPLGDEVRVQYATLPPGSPAPGVGSRLWAVVARVPTADIPTTVHTPPLITPSRVWTRLSGWKGGVRVTSYTDPEPYDLGAQPALAEVTLTVDGGGAVVVWDPGPHTEQARVRWAVGGGVTPAWGSPVDVPARPAAFAIPERPAQGQRVWVELVPMIDAGATLGPAVVRSRARPADFGTEAEPRGWLFTADGRPVRDAAFRVLTESGVAMPGDWLLTTGGAPVRAIDMDILRRST